MQFIIGLIILALAIQYWPITLIVIIVAIIIAANQEDKKETTDRNEQRFKEQARERIDVSSNQKQKESNPLSNLVKAEQSINSKNSNYTVTIDVEEDYDFYYEEKPPVDMKFYGKNQILEFKDFKIESPFVYYTNANNISSMHPFLVSSKLSISFNTVHSDLGYYPSYKELSAAERGIFLNWLNEGKIDQNIDIGFVFIYFYGLEYRVLKEKKDYKEILFEVIRLYDIYGSINDSFSSYAFGFIEYLVYKTRKNLSSNEKNTIIEFIQKAYIPWSKSRNGILYNLDETLINTFKLDEDIYSQLRRDFRKPVYSKYNKESVYRVYFNILTKDIENIFEIQDGKYEYFQANRLLYSSNLVNYKKIVASTTLKEIANKAHQDLKKYANSVNKKTSNGEFKKTSRVERFNYFPQALKEYFPHPRQKSLDKLFVKNNYKVDLPSKFIKSIGLDSEDDLSLKNSKLLAESYEAAGYLIEPDARIINKKYLPDEKIIIYKPENHYFYENYGKDKLEQYHLAATLVDVGLRVSNADNNICDNELNYILQFISDKFSISTEIKERLLYRMYLAKVQEIKTKGLLNKIVKNNSIENLEAIGKYLVGIAGADGSITYEELEIIKDDFNNLLLTDEFLNDLIKDLTTNKGEVVLIQEAQSVAKKGSSIPKPSIDKVEQIVKIELDSSKVNSILSDTSKVQKALNDIFADEIEETIKQSEIIKQEEIETITEEVSLPIEYQELLNVIITKITWSEAELKSECKKLNLMLNSSIDYINEWSEEEYGDFLIEEDDSDYFVNEEILSLINNTEMETV